MQLMMPFVNRHKLLISSFIAFTALIIFYYPIASISLGYFHNDDALLMGKLNDLNDLHGTFNFIFSFDSYKFRPVAYLQYVIEYFLFADNYNAYILYNICLALVLNYIFLLFFSEKSGLFVCIMLSLVIVTSKFLTYSIWNITGSFETLAAIIFLLTVYSVFFDCKSSKKRLALLALLLIFTSERYLPLLLVLPIMFHYRNSPDNFIASIWAGSKYTVAILMAYFVFRYSFEIPLIVGAQTDNVIESFSGTRFVVHVFKSYAEIFGFSVGPKYLTGVGFADRFPNSLGFLISLLLFVVSAYYFFHKCHVIQKATLGFNLIGFVLIMAASITFRLELRWLLPPYLMLLLLFSSNISSVKREVDYSEVREFDGKLFFSIISLSMVFNAYYAIFFRRSLYFAEKLHDVSVISYIWSHVHW